MAKVWMTRDALQDEAANALNSYRRLICQWATGCGKSNVVLKFLQAHPGFRTLILVPETNNIRNWYDEFEKFGVNTLGVDIACYASLHKYENSKWDLLCLDECPHVDTDLKMESLNTIDAEYVVALAAVISEEEINSLKFIYGPFKMSRVTLDECIAGGILPPPQIRVLHTKLEDIPGVFGYDGKTLTAKGVYEAVSAKVNNAVVAYNLKSNSFTEHKRNLAGAERKRMLGTLKESVIRDICRELERRGKRFICFCATVKLAEALGKDKAFTSRSPASYDHLGKFNNHEINSLYVVGKCIEGQNLKDIDYGIIGQIGGKQRITVQSIGRVLRSTHPVIFVPVIDDTKDTGFLYSLTSSISKNYISHHYYRPKN